MRRYLLSAVLFLSVLLSTVVAAQDASYTFTTIDAPNASATVAVDLNNHGQVVGYYYEINDPSGLAHGFLYDQGRITTIDVPAALYTEGTSIHYTEVAAINARGQIIGNYDGNHGFLYEGGLFTRLDPPGALSTGVRAINAQGQIVGYYVDEAYHWFLYEKGVYTIINPPSAPDFYSAPLAINDRGQIVGLAVDSQGNQYEVLYNEGVFTRLDVPGAVQTQATAINAKGQIVGWWSDRPEGPDAVPQYGFLYDDGVFTSFHAPGSPPSTLPQAINAQGQIVGVYYLEGDTISYGFLYEDGVLTRLHVPGAVVSEALAINAQGQIVGLYTSPDQRAHAFLATPTKK
jgi:probable HAF family extracellular repeat protein